MKKSFTTVGCGRVGTAMARYLAAAGYRPAGFASRSLSSAKRASEAAGSSAPASVQPWDVTPGADIILITTPDGAIRETAEKIAEYKGVGKDTVVLHCSGALPSTELAAVADCGAKIGSLHPLQSFADENIEQNPFAGIMMAVEGQEPAVAAAREIAESLGASPFEIRTDCKRLYHASAVAASNYLVTLMNLSLQLIMVSGVAPADSWKVLKPLVTGTLGNIEKNGIPRALTGPIARGDVETVEGHLAEIGQKAPTRLELYRVLGRHTIEIALAGGGLSEQAAEHLKEILAPAGSTD